MRKEHWREEVERDRRQPRVRVRVRVLTAGQPSAGIVDQRTDFTLRSQQVGGGMDSRHGGQVRDDGNYVCSMLLAELAGRRVRLFAVTIE